MSRLLTGAVTIMNILEVTEDKIFQVLGNGRDKKLNR
jgi:hypothetical protein